MKLLLREILDGPLRGFTESKAVVVMPPLPLLDPLLACVSPPSPAAPSSTMDRLEGVRCMERETGIVVITSFGSKPLAEVVIVGSCALAASGKMLNVPVGIDSLLVETVNGNESVVMFVSAGMAAREEELN